MKSGIEYLHSAQKQAFDRKIATVLMPLYSAAKLGASATFGFQLHLDTRVGQGGSNIEVPKIKTLDDSGEPLSKLAETYRNKGLDELAQLELVRSGVMSVVGTRHLLPDEYDMMRQVATKTNLGRELLARHDEIVMPAKRGMLSSFAIHAHVYGGSSVEQRLAFDVRDHEDASLRNDWRMIYGAMKAIANNELVNGSNPIEDDSLPTELSARRV